LPISAAIKSALRAHQVLTVLVHAAVEAHLHGAAGLGLELGDTAKADHLGPEPVRLFEIADVQHQMVDAGGGLRALGRVRHGGIPFHSFQTR